MQAPFYFCNNGFSRVRPRTNKKDKNMVPIKDSKTHQIKDLLKYLGGKWDSANKQWLIPNSKAAEAKALLATVKSIPKKKKRNRWWLKKPKAAKSATNRVRIVCSCCGSEVYVIPRILERAKRPRCQKCGGPLNLPSQV